jgi:transcriptional antiterminator NusG
MAEELFKAGEIVRVTDGPFATLTGTIEEVYHDESRALVSVSVFGRATPMKLSFLQIEHISE